MSEIEMEQVPKVVDVLDHDQLARMLAVTGAAKVLRRSPGFGRSEVAPAYEVIVLADYILTGGWGEEPGDRLSLDDQPLPRQVAPDDDLDWP